MGNAFKEVSLATLCSLHKAVSKGAGVNIAALPIFACNQHCNHSKAAWLKLRHNIFEPANTPLCTRPLAESNDATTARVS